MLSELLCGGRAQRLLRRACYPAFSPETAPLVVSKQALRSEQRSLGDKDLPPRALRRIWPVASLLVGRSPLRGMFPPRATGQIGATNVIAFTFMTTNFTNQKRRRRAQR